jgi:predicted dehydrogenase
MMQKNGSEFRWGILGTGSIAVKFATGLTVVPEAKLLAVGSRSKATADAFADRFGAPRRHASYEALAEDEDVDAIYVATPHSLHRDNSILCLRAGKAVLCEKPFTINAAQARDVINIAREQGCFLMEAMWTRFIPAMVRVRELLAGGAIGEVQVISADFGFRAPVDPGHRLFDPAMGGGALLDVGVYNLSLASMLLGPPTQIASWAHLGKTGVDERAGMVLGYDQGQMAVLHTALRTNTPQEALIMGTEGWIRLHSPWWCPDTFTITAPGREDETQQLPFEGNGYGHEAAEVMHCVRSGRLESDVMPLDETLQIMGTMDQIRAQWDLKYPME